MKMYHKFLSAVASMAVVTTTAIALTSTCRTILHQPPIPEPLRDKQD